MLKSLLLCCTLSGIFMPCAFAEGWTDTDGTETAAQGDTQGNFTFKTGSENALNAGRGYVLENPGRSAFGGWNAQGYAKPTSQQKLNLPPVVTAMPVVRDGVNTGLTGGSIALRTQNGETAPGLMPLPMTGVNSFAWQALKYGKADQIYGTGAAGFEPINAGIHSADLTTGHKSDAPSASGTPLKYNQIEGPIVGE